MDRFEITYTGSYPSACMGELIIKEKGVIVFRSGKYAFTSTGRVLFDEGWNETIESGDLIWNDPVAEERYLDWLYSLPFGQRLPVRKMVDEILEKVSVCCGGCL